MIKLYRMFLLFSVLLFCNSCSLLPKLTFNRTTSTVPAVTDKTYIKEICKGNLIKDKDGNVLSCSKGYYHYENKFNQAERNFTAWEKIQNIVNNLLGWGIPILILLVFFVPGVAGYLFHRFTSVSSKVAESLVKGISDGKKYVRENGSDYSEAERKIYIKGADDMLAKISDATTDPKVKEEINKLRAKL